MPPEEAPRSLADAAVCFDSVDALDQDTLLLREGLDDLALWRPCPCPR